MKKQIIALISVWVMMLACQVIPTPPPLTPTTLGKEDPPSTAAPEIQLTASLVPPIAQPGDPVTPAFELEPIYPLSEKPFADTTLLGWERNVNGVDWMEYPVDMTQVKNRQVIIGLTNTQQRYLAQNGFVAIQAKQENFSTIRHKVSMQYGQPYFLTSDAASDALKSTLDSLFIALEHEVFYPRLVQVVRSTLEEAQGYLPVLQGAELEKDAKLAVVYLAAGLHLLDPSAEISLEPDLEALYLAQVEQIFSATAIENMVMLPGIQLDFTTFDIPDIYQGDSVLEAYFLGKTWFEQVGFPLEDRPGLIASRAPLIINLALRRASFDSRPTAQLWAELDEVMAFFYGRSPDDDPRRYSELIDRVYGTRISVLAFNDAESWRVFRVLAQTLPPSQANTMLAPFASDTPGAHDWRFLGRRHPFDKTVLSSLPVARDQMADLPHFTTSGLDWMSALGWLRAQEILGSYAVLQQDTYTNKLESFQRAIQSQRDEQWQSTYFGAWSFAFLPVVESAPDDFPLFMGSPGWNQKSLNSALSSWSLAHHRAAQIIGSSSQAIDPVQPISPAAPAYVEPSPDVFYRLSYLANVIVDGLNQRQMTGLLPGQQNSARLADLLQDLRDLGDRLARLGDIAVKEIQGSVLEPEDFSLIQAPLGLADMSNSNLISQTAQLPDDVTSEMAISVVVENGEQMLHAGTGWSDWLYVIVPINGELQIAQGGVFSYYEFNQPVLETLSDVEWQWIVTHAQPERPAWSISEFQLGGSPYFVLAFRKGDVYRITPAGANLSMRSDPSRSASTVLRLRAGDYVLFVDGSIEAEGSTWWKVSVLTGEGEQSEEGWVIESQDWFERSWGQ
ncbi:MAG TPA: DUF3160 domain-containing protein [Anaerolineales bacterium]|nr:DUF3160 domain-containing protein [Anaerolineales bacterium]